MIGLETERWHGREGLRGSDKDWAGLRDFKRARDKRDFLVQVQMKC